MFLFHEGAANCTNFEPNKVLEVWKIFQTSQFYPTFSWQQPQRAVCMHNESCQVSLCSPRGSQLGTFLPHANQAVLILQMHLLAQCFLLGFWAEKILFCLLWIPISMSWEINLVVSVPFYLYYSWFCSLLIPKWNRKCAPFLSSYSTYCVLLHQTREPLYDCFLIIKWE